MANNPAWTKIAEHPNELGFGSNHIALIEVNGKKICVGRHQDRFFAFAHKCPHAGAPMVNGFIDPLGNVVCPLHRYKFNMKTGFNTSGEGFHLKTWPVDWLEDGVYINMGGTGLF